MTNTTVEDAPIPDAILADALFGASNRSALAADLPDEDAPPPDAAATPPDGEAPEEPSPDDVPESPDATAEPETPDEAEEPDAPDTDPFETLTKAGQPLTYTVDGQKKQYEGIFEVEGKGAVIPAQHLGRVRDTIQRAEHAVEQNRKMYAATQEFERVGGMARLADLERANAKLDAAGALFVELLEQPARLAGMLRQNADGSIGFDPEQRAFLIERMQVSATKAELAAQQKWEQARSAGQVQETEAATRTAALHAQIAQLATGLPNEDVEEAKAFFANFQDALFRKATPEDVAKYPGLFTAGELIIDTPKMVGWFEGRRAQRALATETSAKREAAAKFNAPRTAPKPTPKPKAKPPVPRNEDGTFAERKKFDRDDFMRAAMRGEPTPGTQDE